MALFSLISILGFIFPMNIIFKKGHMDYFPFVIIACIVSLLFLSTLLDSLRITSIVIFYFGVLLFTGFSIKYYLDGFGVIKTMISPGIVFFTLSATIYWMISRNLTFTYFDEFATWGIFTKELLLFHKFLGSESIASMKGYSQGSNLFHYFISMNTTQNEGTIYFAHFLLLSAPFSLFFSQFSWKDAHWIFVISMVCFLYVYMLGLGISKIYVDNVISVWFGMTVVLYVYFAANEKLYFTKNLFMLIPILFVLPLIKSIGTIFSIIIIGIIIADIFIRFLVYGQNSNIDIYHNSVKSKIYLIHSIGYIIPLILSFIFSVLSWKIMKESFNIKIGHTLSLPINLIFDQITNGWTNNGLEIIKRFIERCSGDDVIPWIFLSIFIYIISYIYITNKIIKLRIVFISVIMLLGYVFYLSGLYFSYVYKFSEYEGLVLASFNRYSNTFILAIILSAIGLLFTNEKKPITVN